MLTGKRFKLERATLSLEFLDGKRRAVTVPGGSVVQVASGPTDGDGLVNVMWEGRELAMFEVDLNTRGTDVSGRGAKA